MPTRRLSLCFALLLSGCISPPTSATSPVADAQRADSRPPTDVAGPDVAPTLDTGVARVGEACRADDHCRAPAKCALDHPGGMCTRSCKTDADCGDARLSCYNDRCYARCNVRAILNPCRQDYACRLDGSRSRCVPDCRKRACAPNWVCDNGSGLCVDPTAGKIGQACGVKLGSCDGTPNGICYSIGSFFMPFCTLPCAPFTKPCPRALSGASCMLGRAGGAVCAYTCDPKKPACPDPQMTCEKVDKDLHVCLPKR